MRNFLVRSVWAIGLVGIASVVFGFAVLIWPQITLGILIKAFGLTAFAQGVVMAVSAISGRHLHPYWVLSLLWGVIGILAGLYVFNNPWITAVVLLFVIVAHALVRGTIDIVMGVALRDEIDHEWLYIIGGVISVLFGLYVFTRPLEGALALTWLIATYSILSGSIYIATAFSLNSLKDRVKK